MALAQRRGVLAARIETAVARAVGIEEVVEQLATGIILIARRIAVALAAAKAKSHIQLGRAFHLVQPVAEATQEGARRSAGTSCSVVIRRTLADGLVQQAAGAAIAAVPHQERLEVQRIAA